MRGETMVEIDATKCTAREINAEIRRQISENVREITVRHPGAKHNLGVALLQAVLLRIAGSVGYYCGALNDGATVEIEGSAGWGLAESMLSGMVRVRGDVGSGAAAALRGGTVVIHGDAAARLGASIKGGQVIVLGNCGHMAGFLGQQGTLVVCGDTGPAFADSMYATVCYVGGKIASLGTDAAVTPMEEGDVENLERIFEHVPGPSTKPHPAASAFQKVVSERKLWNFEQREWRVWREAL
jgi:methylamine---glutamate N-methyltransferase subunit B